LTAVLKVGRVTVGYVIGDSSPNTTFRLQLRKCVWKMYSAFKLVSGNGSGN